MLMRRACKFFGWLFSLATAIGFAAGLYRYLNAPEVSSLDYYSNLLLSLGLLLAAVFGLMIALLFFVLSHVAALRAEVKAMSSARRESREPV